MIARSRLLQKIFMQNRYYYLFLTSVFVCFLAIFLYGGRMIYEMQTSTLKNTETSTLKDNKKTVREFFSECSRDLVLFRDLPSFRQGLAGLSAEGNGDGSGNNPMFTFLKDHPYYVGMAFVDRDGVERFRLVRNEGGIIVAAPRSGARIRRYARYLSKAKQGGRDLTYASFPGTRDSGFSTVEILSPVFGKGGVLKGLLVLSTSTERLLKRLSPQVYLQDESGLSIGLDKGGKVSEIRSPRLPGGDGSMKLSDTETIAYSTISYLPGQKIVVAKYFSRASFKSSMARLEIISVFIFSAFFIFVLTFSFFTVRSVRRAMRAQNAMIHSLANLSEWRDPQTGSHLERTKSFSVLLAKALRKKDKYGKLITDGFIEDLYDAVPLHDIGKVGIRDSILLKNGRLNAEEFESMKEHVLIGSDVIRDIIDKFGIQSSFLSMSRNICHSHHEKYDGSGYPEGLVGEQIPVEARIFAICDVYDALRSKRPYKEGLAHDEVTAIIVDDRGRHFDPDIVDTFLECRDEFNEIFESYRLFDEAYGKTLHLRSRDAMRLRWSDDLSIGNAYIDSQHKEFLERTNAILSATLAGDGKRETLRLMRFLGDYARSHFSAEEAMMRGCGYPDLHSHKTDHGFFVNNLTSLETDIRKNGLSSATVIRINKDVVLWLVNHIMKSDKMFGLYMKPRFPSPEVRSKY